MDAADAAQAQGHVARELVAEGRMVVAHAFVVGDLVVGTAKKHKPSYHMQKGRVVSVLAKHYSVALLEGEAKGSTHKYLHDNVRAYQVSQPHHPAAASGNAVAPPDQSRVEEMNRRPTDADGDGEPIGSDVMTALTELFRCS